MRRRRGYRSPRAGKAAARTHDLPLSRGSITPDELRALQGTQTPQPARRGRPETALQREVVAWLRSLDRFRAIWTHPANEEADYVKRILDAAMGQNAGWPDLIFLGPERLTLLVELKAPGRRSALSAAQKGFRDEAEVFGHSYRVATSLAEVHDLLIEFGFEFNEPYPARVLRLGTAAWKRESD